MIKRRIWRFEIIYLNQRDIIYSMEKQDLRFKWRVFVLYCTTDTSVSDKRQKSLSAHACLSNFLDKAYIA